MKGGLSSPFKYQHRIHSGNAMPSPALAALPLRQVSAFSLAAAQHAASDLIIYGVLPVQSLVTRVFSWIKSRRLQRFKY
jgi:hypothetical protein